MKYIQFLRLTIFQNFNISDIALFSQTKTVTDVSMQNFVKFSGFFLDLILVKNKEDRNHIESNWFRD